MMSNRKIPQSPDEFHAIYRRTPEFCARAPGRVNLIGEHTDYNKGLVLPMAIEKGVQIWVAPRDDSQVNLYSTIYSQSANFDLVGAIRKAPERSWADYVKGAALEMRNEGYPVRGFDGFIDGDVPVASGLSSSAALEVAAVLTFLQLDDNQSVDPLVMAKLAQKAEIEFIGVNCGLMDQLISAAGVAGSAIQVDCATMERIPVELPDQAAILIVDTKLNRRLADSAYNQRRTECELALDTIRQRGLTGEKLESLSDLDLQTLEASRTYLSDRLYRRVRHVVTENSRVLNVVAALQQGDLETVGKLFNQSHFSLRDDYEVSSAGLDELTSLTRSIPGCFGARLTGAGFGGCAVAIVDANEVDNIIQSFENQVAHRTPRPEIFVAHASEGGRIWPASGPGK